MTFFNLQIDETLKNYIQKYIRTLHLFFTFFSISTLSLFFLRLLALVYLPNDVIFMLDFILNEAKRNRTRNFTRFHTLLAVVYIGRSNPLDDLCYISTRKNRRNLLNMQIIFFTSIYKFYFFFFQK